MLTVVAVVVAWGVVYGTARMVLGVATSDQTLAALVAAVLSFLGSIIVAWIGTHRMGQGHGEWEALVSALEECCETRSRLEAEIADLTRGKQ